MHNIKNKIEDREIQTYQFIISEIFEYYAGLKASGTDLMYVNNKGKYLFNVEYVSDKKYTLEEIMNEIFIFTQNICIEYDVSYKSFMDYFKKQNINFNKQFNILVSDYITSKTRILTQEVLSGDLNAMISAVQNINKETIEQRKRQARLEDAQQVLFNKREEDKKARQLEIIKGNKIITHDDIFNLRKNMGNIDHLNDFDIVIETIVESLISDKMLVIKSPQDLNQYYDKSSGIDNTPEVLAIIYEKYKNAYEFLQYTGITLKTKRQIEEAGKKARIEEKKLTNNIQYTSYIEDCIPHMKGRVNIHAIKIFKEHYKK